MRRVMVIPVYYSRPKSEGHQDGDSVYDHPTPIDEDGTLKRTLESIRIIKNQDFQLVILVSPTSEELTDRAKEKVNKILSEVNLDIQTFIFTPAELEKIKALAAEQDVEKSVIKLMNIRGYANVRNMCIYTAYILGAEMAMLIDDDELFEKEDFVDLASQYIGGRLYGKTIDGVAGYYLNKYGNYYDDVDIEPWMTYWDRFGFKGKAFDKIIGQEPRIKLTPFAFGGAMIIHRNLFKTVPFDPNVTRGEDIDYLINAKMFGFHFFLDRELSIKHLPPKKTHPVWKRFREDIYRFLYEKAKIDSQRDLPNMNKVTSHDFDPYPGNFLTNELEDMIFKANIMLAMDYLSNGDIESAKQTMNNIYLSKYDAMPKFNVFDAFIKLQKDWKNLLKFTKQYMIDIRAIMDMAEFGYVKKYDKKSELVSMSRDEMETLLKSMDFFKNLEDDEINTLAAIAKMKEYPENTFIGKANEKVVRMRIIYKGVVRIQKETMSGDSVDLAILEKGDYFGESFDKNFTSYVDIIAEEDCELIEIEHADLVSLIESHPMLGIRILQMLNAKLSLKLKTLNERYTLLSDRGSSIY